MEAITKKQKVTQEHLTAFRSIVGEKSVFIDDESLSMYAHDETEHLHFLPDVVIKPRTPGRNK